MPAKNAIIDCELVAWDDAGMPNFRILMELGNKAPALCLWCFDLLHLNGEKLTLLPLDQRKALLAGVVSAVDDEHLQFSGAFDDPIRLLETCGKMGFEGIVSKRKESAYRSGPTCDWLPSASTRPLLVLARPSSVNARCDFVVQLQPSSRNAGKKMNCASNSWRHYAKANLKSCLITSVDSSVRQPSKRF